MEVPWSEITLTEGKTAAVEIKSGVELVAAKGAKPPEYWTVEDSKTRSQLAKVHQRFGSTPLPPGDYVVAKGTLRIRGVKVVEGEFTKVADPDLATRLTYATGAGRKTMRELDPEGYKKLQEEVELAIRRGAAWLKKYSVIEEVPTDLSDTYATIGILALVHAGEFDRDPALANRCIEYLLRCPLNSSHGTYVTSLTAMSLRDLNRYRYRQRVLECAQWLIENQGWDDTHRVWSYGVKVPGIGDAKPAAVAAGKRPATKSPMPSGTVSGAGLRFAIGRARSWKWSAGVRSPSHATIGTSRTRNSPCWGCTRPRCRTSRFLGGPGSEWKSTFAKRRTKTAAGDMIAAALTGA